MKIYYDSIEGDKLDVTMAFNFEENGELIDIENFIGTLFKTDKIYFLRGEMMFELNCACDRCAEPAVIKLKHTVEVGIEPGGSIKCADIEYEMTDDDGDTYTTAPDHLDLAEILRQEAILQLPLKRLCRQDCKGENVKKYYEEPDSESNGLYSLKQKLKER